MKRLLHLPPLLFSGNRDGSYFAPFILSLWKGDMPNSLNRESLLYRFRSTLKITGSRIATYQYVPPTVCLDNLVHVRWRGLSKYLPYPWYQLARLGTHCIYVCGLAGLRISGSNCAAYSAIAAGPRHLSHNQRKSSGRLARSGGKELPNRFPNESRGSLEC